MGDHVSIVKPANADAPSLGLVVATLQTGAAPARDAAASLRLAAESGAAETPLLVHNAESAGISAKEVVDAALALERAGRRGESIALLERHKDKDTDVKGTLAGRFKRIWFESGRAEDAGRALTLYSEALQIATAADQIYYLAINAAFMNFAYRDDAAAARSMAELALSHAAPPGADVWKTATVAEAYLYLDRIPKALAEYRRLIALEAEEWKHRSASLQAGRIAAKLGNRALAEELEQIFTPGARRVNRIFVAYSRHDGEWIERLKTMIAPYLRQAEAELDLWDDRRIASCGPDGAGLGGALRESGVAVALVSSSFLASNCIMDYALPSMAAQGGGRLLWAYISAAGWEETPLANFQAAHDIARPLDALPKAEQNEILKSLAQQMKAAALGATGRFKSLPAYEQTA